ncbi:hypothetical protein [Niastella sp. OAS944]|uniref:hypothetical protein n=1 Tax=Niastella sp. OAS944 TaxID=2664089 RepID=UPI00347F7DA6|nr:hypothetical protein [Chitinophagaceae bacterium OAS944]
MNRLYMRNFVCMCALITLLLPVIAFSQIATRKYKIGERYKYKLTTETWRNDKYTGKTVSTAEHQVVNINGILSEEIKWISKITYNGSASASLDSIAQKVAPYRISLLPNGKVLLPALTVSEMVGEVTDLNTFFVAVAPASNAGKVSAKDTVYINKEPRQGNFADSVFILYGTDCIEMSQHFITSDKLSTTIRTDFLPPASFCLTPKLDTVATQLYDQPNNFQMIQKGAGDKVNFFWGVETFTITSRIDNKTGAIIEAGMENTLNLQMRYNASKDLQSYAIQLPVKIKRHLKLELVKE